MSKILLTAVGCPGFMEIYRALHKTRLYDIIGTDNNQWCAGYKTVQKFYHVPHGREPDYLEIIQNIVNHEDIDAILPESTPELLPLSRVLYAVVSDKLALKRTINKGRMLGHFDDEIVPQFRVVATPGQMERAVQDLGYPREKVVIKPCVADGSRGLRVLSGQTDMIASFLGKPDSTISNWGNVNPFIHAAYNAGKLPDYLVMEYLPGVEYSVDCIPQLNVAVVRTRNTTRSGIAWVSSVIEKPALSNTALSICDKLELKYNINLQFKEDSHQVPKLIEINPRVSGTIAACIHAGINLPNLAVKKFLGKSIRSCELKYKTGTFYRYWSGVWSVPL
jgi:carbamoyl-phosphate synthase large subunit